MTVGILTTFQLGQGYVKTDTIDFSNNTVIQNQDKKAPSLNKNTNIKKEVVTDEEKSAVLILEDSTSTMEVAEK